MGEIHLIVSVDTLGIFQNCSNTSSNLKESLSNTEKVSVNARCPECCFSLKIILHKIVDIKEETVAHHEEFQHPETFVTPAGYNPSSLNAKTEVNNEPDKIVVDEDESREESFYDEPNIGLVSSENDEEESRTTKDKMPIKTYEKKSDPSNIIVKAKGLECLTCKKTYHRRRTLLDHLKNVHKILQKDDTEDYQVQGLTCLTCSKTFKNNRTLDYHLNNIHGAEVIKKKKRHLTKAEKMERERIYAEQQATNPPPQEFPKEGELLCKICNKMFGNTSKLKAHLRKLHNVKEGKRIVTNPYKPGPGEFVCPKCNREFTAPGNFGYHIKTCNPDLDYTTLTCLLCNLQCASKQRLYSHYDRIHKRKICDQCGKSFSKAQSLAEHITKHLNPEPYMCDLCDTRFRSKDQVETHMLKRHMVPTCYCTQCDPPKPFAKELQLKKHVQRVHLKLKTIQCPECPHLCKNDFDLKKHLFAKHTAPEIKNQFPCEECDFVTSTEAYLRKHKLTHLPDEQRPYKCQYCIKGFRLVYDLERHEMSHNGIRPYSCKVCGKGFITNTELKQHYIAQHTDDRPFICEICQVGHKDRWAYRNHLTAHERQMGVTLDKSIGKFMHKYKDLQL